MRRLLFALALVGSTLAAPSKAPDWRLIENRSFSFSLPSTLKKTDARGIDSFVEEYVAEGIEVSFDFGIYSNNFGDWPKDTKFESLTIHGKTARIGVAKRDFHQGYPFSTKVYIKVDDHVALSMFAACRSEKEVALAREIFLTISFNAKKG